VLVTLAGVVVASFCLGLSAVLLLRFIAPALRRAA
jgi:hypothetical protein